MPMYDYKCKNCGHQFEQMQKIVDREKPAKKPCPKCKKKKLEFQIGAPACCDPVRIGRKKPDKGFAEVMAKMREKNPINNLNDRWGY